jgi:hypothetical protein
MGHPMRGCLYIYRAPATEDFTFAFDACIKPILTQDQSKEDQMSMLKEWLKLLVPLFPSLLLLLTFVVTYIHNVNVRAGDLLLKLEETFSKLGSKLTFLEYKATCYDPIKGILRQCISDSNLLQEEERNTLGDLDQCIRFLYICSLLAGDKIHAKGKTPILKRWTRSLRPSRHLPLAYYYYLNRLNDHQDRPELCEYVERFFPLMRGWLERNGEALQSYVVKK